jgi:ATP/ADP translocase/HEAT repeat protein
LTDLALTPSAKLTTGDRFLASIGIRREDRSATALMFSNMFMSGIAIGMIRVCAFTLFLEHWGSEQLALIAILIALVGMPMTLVIDRLTHRFAVRNYLFTLLGIIFAGLALMRLSLGFSESPYLIFTLPLFFELVYMLFSLQFVALLSRLLNVRQTKRLSGIARSGEFLAELAGGFLILLLLNFIQVTDLLVVAMFTTLLVFGIVSYTVSFFRSTLYVSAEEPHPEEAKELRLLGMLKLPYVRLITFCYITYMFAYFFLDVAFYNYAAIQFPDEKTLAAFIAQFFAASGFLTMMVMVFFFAPFLRKFGIIGGIITFPAVIFIGSTAVTTMEFSGFDVAAIFAVMVVTNASRIILQSAIWKSSVTILFQVLPDRQRSQGIALTEGVIDPVAGGLAGVCLYVLTTQLGLEPKHFLIILSVLMLGWVFVGFYVRRLYLSNLVVSIQKRKLGEISLADLDNASLDIIKQGLNSNYPAEVFYCLNLLEEIEHPEITELLKTVLDNNNRDVRMDVLRRIASMEIKPLLSHVLKRIEHEPDPEVRGQALKTYAALAGEDTVEMLQPFLDGFHEDLRKGALVGILSFDREDDTANNYLLRSVRSADESERIFAADVIGEIGSGHFSGYLVELLDDLNLNVVEPAIVAAGQLHDSRLVNILVNKLSIAGLQGSTALALRQFGEAGLYDLDVGLMSPEASRQEKFHIIDTIREIGGERAIEILLRHLEIDQPELRHQINLSLASLHYQADPDDQYIFVNSLDEEVQLITWLLAAMEDLYGHEKYKTLHGALASELDVRRDNMLLLISFLFPSIVMLDTRANIDSKVAELRVFALEILDNLLTGEIKQIVLPLLDDLSVAERLEQMSVRFPQQQMTPDDRFHDVVESHFDRAFFWTRSCMLYQIGLSDSHAHFEQVEKGLVDKESVIRETSLWCLEKLDPPDLRRRVSGFIGDRSKQVSDIARAIYTTLPDPEPDGAN